MVWLCKTKTWWKSKIGLYGYRHFIVYVSFHFIWICFIVYIKADDIYKDIGEDVETRLDSSNYELDRPLPKLKIKK